MILKIVKPAPDAPEETKKALAHIAPGSVIVAITREHRDQIPDPAGVWLYYEGGLYEREQREPTEQEKRDYAIRAAGRAAKRYPTTAKLYLPSMDGLVPIGFVDTSDWTVITAIV